MRAPNLAPGIPDLAGGCMGGACPCDHPESARCEACGAVDPREIDVDGDPALLCASCRIALDDGRLSIDDLEGAA